MLHFIKINVKIKHKIQHPRSIIKEIVLMMNSYISSKATKNKISLSVILKMKFSCRIVFYLNEKSVLKACYTIPVALQS